MSFDLPVSYLHAADEAFSSVFGSSADRGSLIGAAATNSLVSLHSCLTPCPLVRFFLFPNEQKARFAKVARSRQPLSNSKRTCRLVLGKRGENHVMPT